MKEKSETVFADDTTLYLENPRVQQQQQQQNVKTNKRIWYSCRRQNKHTKSGTFLYITSKLPERKIKEAIPLTKISKRIKYLGIHLTKEVKDLFIENFSSEERSG